MMRGVDSKLLLTALVAVVTSAADAQTAHPVIATPDITADLGTAASAIVRDHDAASDDGFGSVAIPAYLAPMFAAIPANAEVADFELSSSPAVGWLLTIDTAVSLPGLPGGALAEPRDVVRFDRGTSTFSVFFDGSANAIPSGVSIDAVAVDASDRLLLSFDTTLSLPGAGMVADEDIVRFQAGSYALEFDGSAAGIAGELDLDAAHRVRDSNLLLVSFDGHGNVPGVTFADEDVLAYDTVAHTWAMYFDGSQSDPNDWPAADLVALPEPGPGVSMLCGAAALAASRRRWLCGLWGSR